MNRGVVVGGRTFGRTFSAMPLVCIKGSQARMQHVPGGIAQVATNIVVYQALGGHVHSVTNLLFCVMKVLFDVGIAVHDQSPGESLSSALCK